MMIKIVGGVSLLLIAIIVYRSLLFRGTVHPAEEILKSPIIDMHCHTAGIGAGGSGCFISSEMRESYKFRVYLKGFGVDLASVESAGDSLIIQNIAEGIRESRYVSAAIVLAMDGVINDEGELDKGATEFYVPNEFVLNETQKYPELFWAASINPKRKDAIERLIWAYENGTKMIKWLPSIQGFDPADISFLPFYKKLAELKIPLLSHAGRERAFTNANDEYADPIKLKLALETGVKVIVAHIASSGKHEGEKDSDRLREMMKDFPHLYSEISSLTQINKLGYLDDAITYEVFEGQLLYGSDYPLINTALVSPWFFSMNLDVETMKELDAIHNSWDRDVELKRALGVPNSIFTRANTFLMTEREIEDLEDRTSSLSQ